MSHDEWGIIEFGAHEPPTRIWDTTPVRPMLTWEKPLTRDRYGCPYPAPHDDHDHTVWNCPGPPPEEQARAIAADWLARLAESGATIIGPEDYPAPVEGRDWVTLPNPPGEQYGYPKDVPL